MSGDREFPTFQHVKEMTLDQATAHLARVVYEAGLFFERLENAGKIHGNGHHMAQNLAAGAVEELRSRWLQR